MKSADPLDAFIRAIGEVIGSLFLPLFCVVDVETSNSFILSVFPLFLKMVADFIAPKLSLIFCGLIRRGRF